MWRQLKRASIHIFDGDNQQYGNWKSEFKLSTDHATAASEYKPLRLRQYLPGDAPKSIEGSGHSGYVYEAAKECMEG